MRQTVWTIALLAFIMGSNVSRAAAGGIDVISPDGALFTASTATLLWLGAAQGIIETCDGDVRPINEKRQALLAAASEANGGGYADVLSGVFDEGQRLGRGMGCNVNQYRLYEEYAALTYGNTLKAFLRADQ